MNDINPYEVKPPEPKVVSGDYIQSFDNLTSNEFMQIYLETLRYQDPFKDNDLSKMLEDMVRLNQIRFFNDVQTFINSISGWFNQMTFINGVSLIGKSFVFSTDTIDTVKGGTYYLLSPEDMEGVKIEIYDGDQKIKEIEMDLSRGLNKLDISDLPKGQYTIKVVKDGLEIDFVSLGYEDTITAVGIINGELIFDLESGRQARASQILYAGGVKDA